MLRAGAPGKQDTRTIMKIHDPADNVWTAQQDEDLKLQLANGRSVNEVALRMKRSPLAVRTRVNKLGIREVKE